jgi:serine/threonine protein phosphatase 1
MGDIHGGARAVDQCLGRARFDRTADTLVCLGDVCDGWPETSRAVDVLLGIPNLIYLMGNHDYWTLSWMQRRTAADEWLAQGGEATIASYMDGVPPSHIHFLRSALPYHQFRDVLFVHAGVQPHVDLKLQDMDTFLWDRQLVEAAMLQLGRNTPLLTAWREVYVGHTPHRFGRPVCGGGVWMMDTGAGWSGTLSMMNIETKEVFCSDPLPQLYPGIKGRKPRS